MPAQPIDAKDVVQRNTQAVLGVKYLLLLFSLQLQDAGLNVFAHAIFKELQNDVGVCHGYSVWLLQSCPREIQAGMKPT